MKVSIRCDKHDLCGRTDCGTYGKGLKIICWTTVPHTIHRFNPDPSVCLKYAN